MHVCAALRVGLVVLIHLLGRHGRRGVWGYTFLYDQSLLIHTVVLLLVFLGVEWGISIFSFRVIERRRDEHINNVSSRGRFCHTRSRRFWSTFIIAEML